MNTRDAVSLLATAIPGRGGTWADFGAGEGTFTRALAELLGPNSRIYAIDRDASALSALVGLAEGQRSKGSGQTLGLEQPRAWAWAHV